MTKPIVLEKISRDDLNDLFEDELTLFSSVKDLLWNLECKSLALKSHDGKLYINVDGQNTRADAVDANLQKLAEEYFEIVEEKHGPRIGVTSYQGNRVVEFSFWQPNYIELILVCSPDYRSEGWEHLEGAWYAYYNHYE